ncbi:MAG TPA: SRPBCC domain-containing protein [Candidatus Tyrphobacter sp.]
MTKAPAPAVPALVLRRTYKATRERVFAAWTTPEIAETFLGPGDTTIPDIQMDVRPGGTYRITMLLADGERMVVKGMYREVIAPKRLSMTWCWEEENPADERDTLLSLDFNDIDGETELVLTHEQFATAESRDRHEHGWTLIADQLASVV